MGRIENLIEFYGLRDKSDEELDFIFWDAAAAWDAIHSHSSGDAIGYADLCFAVSRVERERHPVRTKMTITEAWAADGKL